MPTGLDTTGFRTRVVTRRRFLQTSVAAGTALATTSATACLPRQDTLSLIHVYLPGGPSHLDTFDLKPGAPAEIRGEFRPIATSADGVQICELLPRLARWAHRYTLIRSVTGLRDEHSPEPSDSGWSDRQQQQAGGRPGIGAVLSATAEAGSRGSMPVAVDLTGWTRSGYLARGCYDASAHVSLRQQPRGSDARELTETDRWLGGFLEATGGDADAAERYGMAGQPQNVHFLRAGRLIEAGVRYVGLSWGFWDTHGNNFRRLRQQLPRLDQGLTALLEDLERQGRLDDVVILMSGEFGRSPRINDAAGRDHWPGVSFLFVAGGPLPHGQVIGATDRFGGDPLERAIRLDEIYATIYETLGIDATGLRLPDRQGCPQRLLAASTEVIPELLDHAAWPSKGRFVS